VKRVWFCGCQGVSLQYPQFGEVSLAISFLVVFWESVNMGPPKESQDGLAARFAKFGVTNSSVRTEIYSPVEPNCTGFLPVSDTHTLYWEESGNPEGQPIIFLHGGPGSGTSGGNRRFFDPEYYRIILFDQRGAGKSTPHACLEENTTWDLVNDIEKLREHLKVEKWQIFGGSWGSTLALVYSQSHPERVIGIILRGIFLLRKKEINWFYQDGASAIYADAWEPYRDHIPAEERDDFVAAYSKRLNSTDESVQLAAAKAWTNWEMATSYLVPNEESLKRAENEKFALAFARVENHYFRNKGFFPIDSFLLDNVDKIRHIPAVIVQGRYDVVCPMMSAWDLHRAWPEAEFRLVTSAGHSANEPGITSELVTACELHKALSQKEG
jgi:proline iminopeptidase